VCSRTCSIGGGDGTELGLNEPVIGWSWWKCGWSGTKVEVEGLFCCAREFDRRERYWRHWSGAECGRVRQSGKEPKCLSVSM